MTGSALAKTKNKATSKTAPPAVKNPFLIALGARVRALRARHGLTRKALSAKAGISERHLANIEYGEGNASILALLDVATALQSSLADLTGDMTTSSPEWLLIRSLLKHQDEANLRDIRLEISRKLGAQNNHAATNARIALIGLRGAGKSTLGKKLAKELGFPLVEISREVARLAACNLSEIQDLYGMRAYRRYERHALEEAIQIYTDAVICIPGGMVSDPDMLNLLLAHCTTIWLQAEPDDHMQRVIAQNDLRPMQGNKQAMEDLKHILASRRPFYSKAHFKLNTSAQALEPSFLKLKKIVTQTLALDL